MARGKKTSLTPIDFEVPMKLKESSPSIGSQISEDYGWRSLTAQIQRDLSPLVQKRMQEIAYYLYDSNPMAHRIIDIGKEFVIGDGFRFQAADKKVQKVLDDFWNDPDNAWDIKQDSKVLELSLWGEQCYPVYVNEHNGHVKLGYLDPGLIKTVRLDSENPERVKQIEWAKRSKIIKMRAINADNRVASKTQGMLVGDCFYFSINRVVTASRGRSDLLTLCLHPDTVLNTLNGDIPIKKLAGKEVLIYSWDQEKNELVIGKATNIRKTRKNSELVKIHFTNGDSIITTPDHPILLINAQAYRQAKDFLPSDRVQAVARKIKEGYVWVQYKKKKWMLEHRFIMEKVLGRKLSSNEVVHHKNGNTLDNSLTNLQVMSRADHAFTHIDNILLTPNIMNKTKRIISEIMKGNQYALGNKYKLTKEQIEKVKIAKKEYYANLTKKENQKLSKRMKETSHARFQKGKKINQYVTFNHEVAFVEKLNYKSDVYDLDVSKYHNFSANGIIVHNCDWIDGYDQFLFARLERAFLLNNFIWDILCEGMSEKEIKEFAKNLKPPAPGSARVHNEKIKYNTVSPKLESADASAEANMFKTQILGGAGYPDFWFGESDKTTRATAMEVGVPTLKKLRGRQKYIKYMISSIFNFVIDQKIIHKMLPKDVNRKFIVLPAPIITKDARGLAITLDKFANAMSTAVDKGWITEDTAKTSFRTFMTDLGIELHELESLVDYANKYKKAEGGKDAKEIIRDKREDSEKIKKSRENPNKPESGTE